MYISPKFTSSDWEKITFQSNDEWQLAADIFKDRIRERFLDPIARIEKCNYAGFAVLALDCLLIEMLQQFREGVSKTPSGQSKAFFVRFLTETDFGQCFDTRQAELFYRHIRCGILHQAEVRGSSRVLIDSDMPMVSYSNDNKGLVINRKCFHDQMLKEFESYIEQLLTSGNEQLRNRFRKKMKAVCRSSCEII